LKASCGPAADTASSGAAVQRSETDMSRRNSRQDAKIAKGGMQIPSFTDL
jgi:hypothetical protein